MKRTASHYLSDLRAQMHGDDAQYRNCLWAMREAGMDQQARELRRHHRLPPRLTIVRKSPSGGNVIAIPIKGRAS